MSIVRFESLNIFFSWNQKTDSLENCYVALGTQVLPRFTKYMYCLGLTLTFFMARSILLSDAFIQEMLEHKISRKQLNMLSLKPVHLLEVRAILLTFFDICLIF